LVWIVIYLLILADEVIDAVISSADELKALYNIYAFVAFDLFVKHRLFYSGVVIILGIEVLPMKSMQSQMSSGVAYFEDKVYNVMCQRRSSPLVPLLIIGIEL